MDNRYVAHRRLAAVAFADVADFTRLVEADDVGTTRRWRALRRDLIEPRIVENGGKLLRVVGDALLVEFGSAVGAVRWAQAVQLAMADVAGDPPLALRIGINVEDVIVDEDELHGDGVNVAAHIQTLAGPGEVIVTAAVREYVWNKLPVPLADLGERWLKNLSRPVRLYRLEIGAGRVIPRLEGTGLAGRPSVAVLPFRNIAHDVKEAYFGEGVTEDIIAALSRSRALTVIARTSTLGYQDRGGDLRRVSAELGARYVVDGSVRRQAERLRVAVELVDPSLGRTLWADCLDGVMGDLLGFQSRIASSVAAAIEPRLIEAETARVRAKPTGSLDAYDCVLRALPLLYTFEEADFWEAGAFIDRAIALDPAYAQAHAYKAFWLVLLLGERGSRATPRHARLAESSARRAVSLDPADAFGLTVAAHVEAFVARRADTAAAMHDAALRIHPNSAFAWGMSAITCCYLGEPERALERLAEQRRLSPFDPLNFFFWGVTGFAELLAGNLEDALSWLRKGLRGNPGVVGCMRSHAACLGLLGRMQEAADAGRELLACEPGFRVSAFAASSGLKRPEHTEMLVRGLRLAGMPE